MKQKLSFVLWCGVSLLSSAVCLPGAGAQELILTSQAVDGTVPESPDDPRWAQVHGVAFPLQPQIITEPKLPKPTVSSVSVRSVNNGTRIAFVLEWPDGTRNVTMRTREFRDAAAIQFPLESRGDMPEPSPFMGHEGAPVYIMHWKADWQEDLDTGYVDMKRLYPNLWVDFYLDYSVGRDARNLMSSAPRTSPVEECIAEGFGTLMTQAHQDASGKGIWRKGVWRVVFFRDMDTGDPSDTVLKRGNTMLIAFAVWDGEAGTGSRKAWGGWFPLKIAGP